MSPDSENLRSLPKNRSMCTSESVWARCQGFQPSGLEVVMTATLAATFWSASLVCLAMQKVPFFVPCFCSLRLASKFHKSKSKYPDKADSARSSNVRSPCTAGALPKVRTAFYRHLSCNVLPANAPVCFYKMITKFGGALWTLFWFDFVRRPIRTGFL